MTKQEFNYWLDDYFGHFPSTEKWLRETGRQQQILENWQRMLADVELADASLVTADLAAGREPPIQSWDRERTAHIVLSTIREKQHRQQRRAPIPPGSRPYDFDRRRMIRNIWNMSYKHDEKFKIERINRWLAEWDEPPIMGLELEELKGPAEKKVMAK